MSLKNWADAGWIQAVPPDPEIISRLLLGARDHLRQCVLEGLAADWRFIIAYTAVLNTATACLLASGYRADRDQHHFRTLQSLEHTLGLSAATIRQLDAFRKKRNSSTYDRSGAISDHEVIEITKLAGSLLEQARTWMGANHPANLPED